MGQSSRALARGLSRHCFCLRQQLVSAHESRNSRGCRKFYFPARWRTRDFTKRRPCDIMSWGSLNSGAYCLCIEESSYMNCIYSQHLQYKLLQHIPPSQSHILSNAHKYSDQSALSYFNAQHLPPPVCIGSPFGLSISPTGKVRGERDTWLQRTCAVHPIDGRGCPPSQQLQHQTVCCRHTRTYT
jgi:hypothetical protein